MFERQARDSSCSCGGDAARLSPEGAPASANLAESRRWFAHAFPGTKR